MISTNAIVYNIVCILPLFVVTTERQTQRYNSGNKLLLVFKLSLLFSKPFSISFLLVLALGSHENKNPL